MIPFQLHRRIPFVRRPFYQRDRAIAERDQALSALGKLTVAARKPVEGSFALPSDFATVSIAGDQAKQFQVVVEAHNPPSYDQWIISAKPYSDIAQLLIHLLRGAGTLIDLGANIGTVSLPVAATGSRVIAIEVLPRNVMKLTLAGNVNSLPHFRVVQAAVTDRDGMVGYAGDEAWGQVSTEQTTQQAVGLRLDTIIDLIELDSPQFLQAPVVMKIDIEGHELAALRGAERFLALHRPTFAFESIQHAQNQPDNARQVKDLLVDLGYELHLIRGDILSPHLQSDAQIQPRSDILAIPSERRAAIVPLLNDYAMRPLTAQEQLDWIREMTAYPEYTAHLAAVIPQIKRRLPEFAKELDLIQNRRCQSSRPMAIAATSDVRFNTALSLEHFDDDALRLLMRDVFTHFYASEPTFPSVKRFAKVWETAMCVRGLRAFGAVRPDAEILGVGAGEECTLFYLTRHVRRVFATDLYAVDANIWATAKRSMLVSPETSAPPGYPWNPKRLVVQHMDALALRYEDASFDGLFSCGSIEHFGDLDAIARAAREMGRVLKPGGILTLATEFRLEGPANGIGIPGTVIFSPAMLWDAVIDPSGLELVDEPNFATTPATRQFHYPLAEAVSQGIRDPSFVLEHDGYSWTSVALCLRKPTRP